MAVERVLSKGGEPAYVKVWLRLRDGSWSLTELVYPGRADFDGLWAKGTDTPPE